MNLFGRSERTGRTVTGTVKTWHADKGWGVLVSPDAPGEVWAGFHSIQREEAGHRELSAGQVVEFEYRAVYNQDGYKFVADWVREVR